MTDFCFYRTSARSLQDLQNEALGFSGSLPMCWRSCIGHGPVWSFVSSYRSPFSSTYTLTGTSLATATYSVANQFGFFTANDLSVVYNQVPNSTAAFQSLLNGQYDILTATVDNALNYRFNQAQNVTVAGQLDQGPDLVIASVPGITNITQLKGKPIIVDSPTSGYAYLLQNTLAANGLYLNNSDYYFMVRWLAASYLLIHINGG